MLLAGPRIYQAAAQVCMYVRMRVRVSVGMGASETLHVWFIHDFLIVRFVTVMITITNPIIINVTSII